MRGLGGVTIGTDPHVNSECVRPNCFVYGLTLGCLCPGKPLIFMRRQCRGTRATAGENKGLYGSTAKRSVASRTSYLLA